MYGWIDSTDPAPRIIWDLRDFKQRLNSEHGVKVILLAYDNLPTCSEAQIVDFATRLATEPKGSKVPYSPCKFPDVFQGIDVGWFTDQLKGFENSLQSVVQNVPNEVNLTSSLAQGQTVESAVVKQNKRVLRGIRTGMGLAWLMIVVPMLLILLLAVRSTESLARWWGIPLMVSGVFTLLPGLVYRGLVTSGMDAIVSPDLPPVIAEEAARLTVRLADAAFRPMIFQAVILLLAGIGLLTWQAVQAQQRKQAARAAGQI
jgi:hypothetical protein